jgi:hypothetical protein
MVGMSTPKGTKPSDFANQANKNVAQDKTKKAASDAAPEPKKGKASKKGQAKDKEVDMKTFGDKKLSKKKDKPENSEPAPEGSPKKKKKEKDSDETSGKKTPMPSFSSIAKPMLTGKKLPQNPKWKIGKTVDLGHAGGGYKVVNKTGSWYNLERNGEKYVFIPFKGLRKIS